VALSADHPIARFVCKAEYVACGGRIERDLFAAEGEGQWLDGDLAMELATKKLAFEAEVAESAASWPGSSRLSPPMSPTTTPKSFMLIGPGAPNPAPKRWLGWTKFRIA
jgi:hypothetical protein